MTIQRAGPTPEFYRYVCEYALIPNSGLPSIALTNLGSISWVEIPSFQRGISWGRENVLELLQSKSILLGNAILSQVTVTPGQFPHLPTGYQNYHVLVDGLQRFAVGTAILSVLHDLVLSPTPSRPGAATAFLPLGARVSPLEPFYAHNNTELLAHPRQAIRDQYKALRSSIADYVLAEIDAGRAIDLAKSVLALFLVRQLALDTYFNFSRIELLSTFIGINTVRVDLGPVDLLRASILERATAANWSQADLEAVENDFTDTLTDDQKPKQDFIPFVNAALKTIENGKGSRLFPSWSASLQKGHVDDFLAFVSAFENPPTANGYLTEILLCGKLPASTVFAHYYLDYLHGSKKKPSFFIGNHLEDAELHQFLIACYRLWLAGEIGRTTDTLEALVDGTLNISLQALADHISNRHIGKPIASPVDLDWLETRLNGVEKKGAPRVFNAMLLPARTAALGASYSPLTFGRSSKAFHVDHLIPESMLTANQPGYAEGQSLRNLAPLPRNQNTAAKATGCAVKLSKGGIYANYVASGPGGTHVIHPYCTWLLSSASALSGADLDAQLKLEKNSSPDIGSPRVRQIAAELLKRI